MAHVPNALSILRILSAPVIVYFLSQNNIVVFSLLFAFACATDVVDGYIARRFHLESKSGVMLDAIADKTLMVSAFTGMVYFGYLPLFALPLLLLRDIVVLMGAMVIIFWGKNSVSPGSIQHSHVSKATTVLQFIAVFAFLFNVLPYYALAGTALAGTIAGFGYIRDGLKYV